MTSVLAPPSPAYRADGLPLAPTPAGPAPAILVADDDDDIRDVIAFKPEMSGFRALTADNGHSALAIATEQRPSPAELLRQVN